MLKWSRGIGAVIAALMVVGVAGGCSSMPWNRIAENIENSKQLRVGMTKTEVLEIMGEPISDETYCTPDVWFYYINTVWADGLITEDECMPLVFADGKLAGWGNAFYTDYRIKRKAGVNSIDNAANLEL